MQRPIETLSECRSAILEACRGFVEDNAAVASSSPEMRPVIQARVLSDITDAMSLEGACKDREAARRVAQEARLFLRGALNDAGLGLSLDGFIAAGHRRALSRLGAHGTVADLRDGAASLPAVAALVESISLGEEWKSTVPTGLRDLDEKLNGGLPLGEITLIGAPTGMGKTTVCVQIAYDAARHERGMVLVVSPEMQARDLWLRLAQRETGYARNELRPGHRNHQSSLASIMAAASVMSERSNLVLLDRVDADVDNAMDAARYLHAERGPLYLLVLDYAQQLAKVDGEDARYQAVGKVATKALKVAEETGAAVLITSQVNGIRGKGGEIVDFTFRESQVLEHKAAVSIVMAARYDEGIMEFTMRKNRHGAMGKVEASYNPAVYTLKDMAPQYQEEKN